MHCCVFDVHGIQAKIRTERLPPSIFVLGVLSSLMRSRSFFVVIIFLFTFPLNCRAFARALASVEVSRDEIRLDLVRAWNESCNPKGENDTSIAALNVHRYRAVHVYRRNGQLVIWNRHDGRSFLSCCTCAGT